MKSDWTDWLWLLGVVGLVSYFTPTSWGSDKARYELTGKVPFGFYVRWGAVIASLLFFVFFLLRGCSFDEPKPPASIPLSAEKVKG